MQIRRDDRHHVGVDHRRRCPLVLLDLGQHLEGDRDPHLRRLARDNTLDCQLMRRIGKRVDQADSDGLDLFRQQRVDLGLRIRLVEWALDAAGCIDTLVHDASEIALDQGRRLLPGHVVEPRHAQRAQLEHVAKTLGGDQPDPRALVLEDRIRGDRGAMPDFGDGGSGEAGLGEYLEQTLDDRRRVVADARRDLLRMDGAVAAEQNDIGECAADVDADAEQGSFCRHCHHSATFAMGSASCRCTFGTSFQPRAFRIAACARSVAAPSIVQPRVSMTTP